jgi:hypothetical protein
MFCIIEKKSRQIKDSKLKASRYMYLKVLKKKKGIMEARPPIHLQQCCLFLAFYSFLESSGLLGRMNFVVHCCLKCQYLRKTSYLPVCSGQTKQFPPIELVGCVRSNDSLSYRQRTRTSRSMVADLYYYDAHKASLA